MAELTFIYSCFVWVSFHFFFLLYSSAVLHATTRDLSDIYFATYGAKGNVSPLYVVGHSVNNPHVEIPTVARIYKIKYKIIHYLLNEKKRNVTNKSEI